jgi:hypothetical protein
MDAAGLVACPDNADDDLQDYVLSRGGLVAPNRVSEGLLNILDILECFVKFSSLKNEY